MIRTTGTLESLEQALASNVLNGAKQLNGLNDLNGLRQLWRAASLSLEITFRLQKASAKLLKRCSLCYLTLPNQELDLVRPRTLERLTSPLVERFLVNRKPVPMHFQVTIVEK